MRKSYRLRKVLTFVCLFTFVLLSVPFAVLPAQAARAQNINIGECYQVDSRTPIVVDGLMDEAYTAGFVTYINYPATQNSVRPYTFGVAYFVWSGRSLYCYVIVNDDDIVARRADYWQADCVELYVHRGDDVSRDYPETENEYLNGPNMPVVPSGAHAGRQSGRQYRIDGYSGEPSCYLFGEDLTYFFDYDRGRFYNPSGAMVTDTVNAFGWYEGGFAQHTFESGSSGYAVEYKIDFDTPLREGEKIRFDLMISDRYEGVSYTGQENFYYPSMYRLTGGSLVSNINTYDNFTLLGHTVSNDGIVDDDDLYLYGRYVDSEWPDDDELPDDPADEIEYDTIENGVYYLGKTVVYCDPTVSTVSLRSDTIAIAEGAFAGCLYLESITIPASVTSIGDGAFALCVSLQNITFAQNSRLTDIGMSAFGACALLKKISIPASVTTLGDCAFEACLALKEVSFAKDSCLKTIGTYMFYECPSLTEIVIPASVTSIDEDAFADSSIEHIYYVGTSQSWASIGGNRVDLVGATLHHSPCYYGHNEIQHSAKAPTCTESGWDRYVTCSRCDYTTYSKKSALGHNKTNHAGKTPTCTESGFAPYATCSRCDYTTYEVIPALGHDENRHAAKEPTCTEIGWDAYVTCWVCDYTTYVEKPALGHNETAYEAKAPTCTEIGWDAYVKCENCDHTTYKEKPAFGHNWDGGTVTVQQTCTTPWIVTYTCKNCGEQKITSLNNGELLPHSYTKEVVDEKYLKSPATETESAIYYKSCACGEKGEETFDYGDPLTQDPPAGEENKPTTSGCGGSLGGTGIVFASLALGTVLYSRKKKED